MNHWDEIFEAPHDLRLYVMHTGNVHMKGNIHINKDCPEYKKEPEDLRFNPSLCFLVVHPEKGIILMDTGIHPVFCSKPRGNFGLLVGSIIKIKTQKGMDVLSRIRSLGLGAGDIGHILMTHLHSDHTSGLPLFRGNRKCIVYADRDECNAANAPLSKLKGYIKKHYRGIEMMDFKYSMEVKPFQAVCDLFKDRSILVIKTPGHTKGHVSILLNMKGGPVLITGDAAHRQRNLMERIPTVGDYISSKKSIDELYRFAESNQAVRTIFSHDPDQLGTLKMIPEFYE